MGPAGKRVTYNGLCPALACTDCCKAHGVYSKYKQVRSTYNRWLHFLVLLSIQVLEQSYHALGKRRTVVFGAREKLQSSSKPSQLAIILFLFWNKIVRMRLRLLLLGMKHQ